MENSVDSKIEEMQKDIDEIKRLITLTERDTIKKLLNKELFVLDGKLSLEKMQAQRREQEKLKQAE